VYLALSGGNRSGLDGETSALLDMIILRSSLETELEEEKAKEELNSLLKELELEYWKEKRKGVSREVLRAEEDGSTESLLLKLKEFDDISKKIQYIENGKKS